jgi:diguanylate cyclase (GGDEF)-like protein/PAS domain S-box-containing protein
MFLKRHVIRGLVTAALFFLTGWVAVTETRFDGGFAFIWGASAVLLAYLTSTPARQWPVCLAACAMASVAVTGFCGLGWHGAAPLLAANMIEVFVTLWVLGRLGGQGAFAGSLREIAGFVVACLVGSAAGSIVGGGYFALIGLAAFNDAAFNWFAGHALGLISFTPILTYVARGEFGRRLRKATRRQLGELALVLTLVLVTCVGVFAQTTYPLLFLPLLPITLAAFTTGRMGAGCSVLILAVTGAWFTIRNGGPLALIDGSVGLHVRFLQIYIASVVLCVLPVAVDLAHRKRLLRALRESEARYRLLAEQSTDVIMNVDVEGRIRFISPAVQAVGGYTVEELIGRNANILVAAEHRPTVRDGHLQALKTGESVRFEYVGIAKNGEHRWFETHTRAVMSEDGRADGAVSVIRDISDRKAMESELAEAALTDPLTGLLNRRGFKLASRRLATASESACVALFDIDHFKRVNDTYGHAKGDEVLAAIAALIKNRLRGTDALGRLGGEEFALLLTDTDTRGAQAICDRMRETVADHLFEHDFTPFRVTVSCRLALLRDTEVEPALRVADAALYQAKNAGRNCLKLAA